VVECRRPCRRTGPNKARRGRKRRRGGGEGRKKGGGGGGVAPRLCQERTAIYATPPCGGGIEQRYGGPASETTKKARWRGEAEEATSQVAGMAGERRIMIYP